MASRPVPRFVLWLLVAFMTASGSVGQTPPPEAGAQPPMSLGTPGTVSVRYGDYQRLVARRREVEARLAHDGRAADVVIARAKYDVKLTAETATVVARFTVKTLKADGWKVLQLVGGAVAVSRFEAPMKDAYLVTREMLGGSGEAGLRAGTHYLLTEGGESGDLVLEFVVPAVDEGGVRRAQFVPPPVPLSTVQVHVPAGHLSIQPNAIIQNEDGMPTGARTVTAAIRGGEPLSLGLMPLEMAPTAPPPSGSSAPPPQPQPEVVVDQLHALFKLGDGRLRLRERLAVDVRAVPVEVITLKKPAWLADVWVREEGTPALEEALLTQPLDPEGRRDTVDLKLRAPVANRVLRLVIEGTLRVDPDQPELEVAPVVVQGAREIVEGYVAIVSTLPHPLVVAEAQGCTRIDGAQLPPAFALPDAPLRAALSIQEPWAKLKLKQEVLAAPPAVPGVIHRMDVTTDLAGNAPRTQYKLMVTAPPGAQLTVALPGDGAKYEIGKLMGAVTGAIQPVAANKFGLPLKAGGSDPVPVEFEVRHVGEGLKVTGELALPLLRFDFPARNVRWTVIEPDGVRFWGWGGTFADRAPVRELYLQRFAIGVWGWLGQAAMALAEPAAMFWVVVILLGITLARSAALGRLPLDASIGQLAFLAGIVVLGAVFVQLLTQAANPGPALSDGRGDHRRDERAEARPVVLPPPPRGYSSLDDPSEARRAGLADEAEKRGVESPSPAPSPTAVLSAPAMPQPKATASEPAPVLTAAPAPAPEQHAVFARAVMPAGTDERWLALEASYLERRFEPLATGFAMIVGLALFLASFLALRQLLDVPSANVVGAGALALALYLDVSFPFTAPYMAAGFGLPVILLAAVRAMGHALDTWDAWREEGERSLGRGVADTSRSSETSRSWSTSFPRTTERNEVPIKEIFADTPAPPASDEISFVSEEEESAEGGGEAATAPAATAEAQGGEGR